LFDTLDWPVPPPLSAERNQFGTWRRARVNIGRHVEVERHLYSVPYQLIGQPVEVRLSLATVEIFHRDVRVASYLRSRVPHQATTIAEHRPRSHQKHLEWTPSRLVR
jgi:transposase